MSDTFVARVFLYSYRKMIVFAVLCLSFGVSTVGEYRARLGYICF